MRFKAEPLTPEERREIAMGSEEFVEELTGRPKDYGNAQANLAAIRRRIQYLEDQKRVILAHADPPIQLLNYVNADLAKARQLEAGYQAQIEGKN